MSFAEELAEALGKDYGVCEREWEGSWERERGAEELSPTSVDLVLVVVLNFFIGSVRSLGIWLVSSPADIYLVTLGPLLALKVTP